MSAKKGLKSKNQNFIVEVKCQEHHTWQGTVSWVEGNKKENFRSALELIKLLDSALESSAIEMDAQE